MRGRLSPDPTRGRPVHAGSFIPQRRIVLDTQLLQRPRELARILTHELYHFVWPRLSNQARLSFEQLLCSEIQAGLRGELGWSAQQLKETLSKRDVQLRTRRWRLYVCESFCDTAAWVALRGSHPEFTLPPLARRERLRWFRDVSPLASIEL